jgi:hypothetical protein
MVHRCWHLFEQFRVRPPRSGFRYSIEGALIIIPANEIRVSLWFCLGKFEFVHDPFLALIQSTYAGFSPAVKGNK